MTPRELPGKFRKLTVVGRREAVKLAYDLEDLQVSGFGTDAQMIERADVMVEYAIGYTAIPIGLAPGFMIDTRHVDIPLATEEPSVIAAAAFAGALVARHGGFNTRADEPVMSAQIYLRNAPIGAENRIASGTARIREAVAPVLARMEARGGGLRRVTVSRLPSTGVVRVHLHIDVRDAMGANILNSAAEAARGVTEELSGGTAVMCILSNAAEERLVEAQFSVPVGALARASWSGEQVADRIVEAAAIAEEDPDRAVTHNKGIMNGVTALALATGNDTRAVEAAAHRYACREGHYGPLSHFAIKAGMLEGRIELPSPFGTVGGALGIHPTAKSALSLLGTPDSPTLGRIAAAVGLAQNLAALAALVSEGIQKGHMRLHARRIAFEAGARGEEVSKVAARMDDDRIFDHGLAERILDEIRRNG
ncbi:MAG TPA: hydroxymethylglutaryl-CoA reductase, degradative [Spirochaetia bacterium]|nr:hydroxymethylglutaryl-CoA reductase, degradative [Spirochaetia bacterium]